MVANTPASPEQDVFLRQSWVDGLGMPEVIDGLNAIDGVKFITATQVHNRVKVLNKRAELKRPSWWHASSQKLAIKARGSSCTKVKDPARRQAVPLRELIRFGSELGVPLALRLDVDAVSRAAKRADRKHPGYVVVNNVIPPMFLRGR